MKKTNFSELQFSWTIDHKENLQQENKLLEPLVPPPNVKFLTIEEYAADTFPSLKSLCFLQKLVIQSCPGRILLPDLPEVLKIIVISNYPALRERCQEPDGKDWPKTAHIPQKYTYSVLIIMVLLSLYSNIIFLLNLFSIFLFLFYLC